jgi:hypothetical protein
MDASIRPKGSFKTKDCRVLDISDFGIRLTADNVYEISDSFCIFLAKNAVGREADVKWRRSNQIGAELRTPATSEQNDATSDKDHRTFLVSAAASMIFSIVICALAGLWGGVVTTGVILFFVGVLGDDDPKPSISAASNPLPPPASRPGAFGFLTFTQCAERPDRYRVSQDVWTRCPRSRPPRNAD